jgi:ribosome-binding ATPase
MSLSIGIVGLPNVGKSTLFNALVKNAQAEAKNYPFCTIDPNVGIVSVPDGRLNILSDISNSQKIVPAIVSFVDIAGLVAGASKGEGLGNKFLANIRECDAICEVVRLFSDPNVTHVAGKIDPASDISTIQTELSLKDLEVVEKKISTLEKDVKSGDKNAIKCSEVLKKIRTTLDENKPARDASIDPNDLELIKELGLLTLKPVIYVANVDENQKSSFDKAQLALSEIERAKIKSQNEKLKIKIGDKEIEPIVLSAITEADLNELTDEERKEYLETFDLKESGLDILARRAYEVLGLQTYFTSGTQETRAWTIKKGMNAPQAAGVIHTDFERGFIAADVVKYDDFVGANGWAGAKEKGLIKTCGKDYIVQEGDVLLFKFNV